MKSTAKSDSSATGDELVSDDDKASFLDDVSRWGLAIGFIVRFWTVPMRDAPLQLLNGNERKESFRVTAIAALALLFFVLRPDIKSHLGLALVGLGVTMIAVFLSEALVAYRIKLTERIVLGAYAHLFCVMLVFIIFLYAKPIDLVDASGLKYWPEEICNFVHDQNYVGGVACTESKALIFGFATFTTCSVILLLKSRFVDKNPNFEKMTMVKGVVVTAFFSTLVAILYVVPEFVFTAIVSN